MTRSSAASVTRLCEFIADVLGVDRQLVSPESGLGTLTEWDSMAHIQLVAAFEEEYGAHFSAEEILSLVTVRDFAGALGLES